MKLFSELAMLSVLGMSVLTGCGSSGSTTAPESPTQEPVVPPKPTQAQASSYALYARALRDAKSLGGVNSASISTSASASSITYTFSNHTLSGNASQLNGTLVIAPGSTTDNVTADFKVANNANGITSFKFEMVQPKTDPSKSTGYTWVNNTKYNTSEIISASSYFNTSLPTPVFAQADCYWLYAIAVKDAKAVTPQNPDSTISVSSSDNVTTYTYNEHVIAACGTHLKGTIKVYTNPGSSLNHVVANFPDVTVNPNQITKFVFDIYEPKSDPKSASGSAWVQRETEALTEFDIKDIINVSEYYKYNE